MATKNPYMGTHPDLLPRAHQYPPGAKPRPEHVGERTPVFVDLSQLTSEQIQGLPRAAFTNNEWDELDEDDREAIEADDDESQERVNDLAGVFISRWEWAVSEGDGRSADELVEYGFEQWLANKADDLYDEMPDVRYRSLVARGEEQGLTRAEVNQIINDRLADTNNYSYRLDSANGPKGSVYSEEVKGSVYIEFDDWKEYLEACYPDEVDRAIEKINKEAGYNVDRDDIVPKPGKKYHTFEYNDIDTDLYAHAVVNWESIESICEEAIDEYEIPDSRDPEDAEPPEERVVHRWPDGFYVQDLLPSELSAEGKQMGMCVGRPDMGYGKAVRNGEIKILSLRRPSGKPLFTIEAALEGNESYEPGGGKKGEDIVAIEQVKGKANRRPGFDLGKDRMVYNASASGREEMVKNFKRDEVQRVLEYLVTLGVTPLDVEDVQPAMFVISELLKNGDQWAAQMAEKVPGFEAPPRIAKEVAANVEEARLEAEAARLEAEQGPEWECTNRDVHGRPVIRYVRAIDVRAARAKCEQLHPTDTAIEHVTRRLQANPARTSCEHGPSCTGFCRPYSSRTRRSPKRNPSWGRPTFKFLGTEEALDSIEQADPTYGYVGDVDMSRWDDDDLHTARRVTWVGTAGYLVRIPSKNVLFMEGNQWYPGHGAALLEGIRSGERTTFQVPAARVYRVTAKDVKQTEKYERDGELEYQVSMSEPWKKEEQGEYWAQLLDGNHRAAAAILAGEPYIYVYVGENYRENVRKKDFE